VLVTTLDVPVLAFLVGVPTAEPKAAETAVAGQPATVIRPGRGARWPAIVFVNGATRLGRQHPDVQRLARGLARAGFLVVVPDLPGLPGGEITGRTLAATAAVTRATEVRQDVRAVSLVGVSVGASLALLVAEQPGQDIAAVAGVAPYADLEDVVRLVTTGSHRVGNRLEHYHADPYVSLAVARSLTAGLPRSPDRDALLERLRGVPDEAPEPLAALRSFRTVRSRGVRSLVRLLSNRDPARFDRLYAALPASLRAGIRRLSPSDGVARLRAYVELASAPHDKYFPPDESRELVERAPDARLTVTSALSHAELAPSLRAIRSFLRLDAFVVRSLRAAYRGRKRGVSLSRSLAVSRTARPPATAVR
jgi:pimeloyl-ACP methyl ester carboxylesterase